MGNKKLSAAGLWCITAALASCTNEGEVGGTAEEVHDIGLFELDGNAIDDPAVTGHDWSTVVDVNNLPAGVVASTGVITDGARQTIFNGGGSKDYLDIDDGPWLHGNGNVPPKDNLEHAYAVAYNDPTTGDFIVYFGADRFTTNGSAELGFWFFQQDVEAEADGTFSGEHQVGDLLILAAFTQGGAVSDIDVYEWVGTGGDEGGGTLQTVNVGGEQCGTTAGDDACAITNVGNVTLPWVTGPLGTNSFFEGGINITQIFADQEAPCFASFMAETRSSHEVNAVLKDFILGEFEACDIEVTKTCTGGTFDDETGLFTYDITVDVENLSGQTLYDVTIYETQGTLEDPSDDVEIGNLGEIAGLATEQFVGTITSTVSGPENTVRVTAQLSPTGEVAIDKLSNTAQCPAVEITPVIHVTKDCTVRLDATSGQVVVVVDFGGEVCNNDGATPTPNPGEVSLTNVAVFDTKCTADTGDDELVDTIGTLAPGACADYGDNYTPSSTNSTDPTLAEFSDCVIAVGESDFGNVSDEDDATCPLCPLPTPS